MIRPPHSFDESVTILTSHDFAIFLELRYYLFTDAGVISEEITHVTDIQRLYYISKVYMYMYVCLFCIGCFAV